jgi:hypothetical protein
MHLDEFIKEKEVTLDNLILHMLTYHNSNVPLLTLINQTFIKHNNIIYWYKPKKIDNGFVMEQYFSYEVERMNDKLTRKQERTEKNLEWKVFENQDGLTKYVWEEHKNIISNLPKNIFNYQIMCGYLRQPIGYKLLDNNEVLIRGGCCLDDKKICEYNAPQPSFVYDSIKCPIYHRVVEPNKPLK